MGKSESPPEDLVSVLRTTKNRLAYLSQNDWALIIDKAKRVRFSKNETLIQQGKQTKVVYLLAKGKVNIDVSRSQARFAAKWRFWKTAWPAPRPLRMRRPRRMPLSGRRWKAYLSCFRIWHRGFTGLWR